MSLLCHAIGRNQMLLVIVLLSISIVPLLFTGYMINSIRLMRISLDNMKSQRNELSQRLNLLSSKYYQMECTYGQQADSGGWCNDAIETGHLTDVKLANALQKLFDKKTVASFGEGPGEYKNALSRYTTTFDAFDGSPFIENKTNGNVQYIDLTIPQYGMKHYDWIMSLEVAEHIPPEWEQTYLSNIIRHAKDGIVMSWASPGQGGFKHVNLKTHEYVEKTFHEHCFNIDLDWTRHLRNESYFQWFTEHVTVFRRKCRLDKLML